MRITVYFYVCTSKCFTLYCKSFADFRKPKEGSHWLYSDYSLQKAAYISQIVGDGSNAIAKESDSTGTLEQVDRSMDSFM